MSKSLNIFSEQLSLTRSMAWMKIFCLAFFQLLSTSIISAKTYYVDTLGNDAVNNGTIAKPFRTIQKAADLVQAGDEVFVSKGKYKAFRITNKTGTALAPIIFRCDTNARAVIDRYFGGGNGLIRGIEFTGSCSYITIDGFEITDTDPVTLYILSLDPFDPANETIIQNYSANNPLATAAQGIKVNGWDYTNNNYRIDHVTLKNLDVHHLMSTGILAVAENLTIEHNHLHDNGGPTAGYGMYIGGNNVIIRSNHSHNNTGGHGIRAGNSTNSLYNSIIENNISHDNGGRVWWSRGNPRWEVWGSGITIWHGSGNVVRNNVIYGNKGFGVRINVDDPTKPDFIVNNTSYNNRYQGFHAQYDNKNTVYRNNLSINNKGEGAYPGEYKMGTGNVHDHNSWNLNITDPKFVDTAAGDFRLKTGSPAIDAGVSIPGFSHDYDGTVRPQGNAWDLGAYEYTTPVADINPPQLTNNTVASVLCGASSTNIVVTTDENSTCRYDINPSVSYSSMGNTFSTTGGRTHSSTVSGLSSGSSYTYYVRCKDATGNVNTVDMVTTFSVSTSGSILPSGATGHWPFEEGSGATANDIAGVNNGVLKDTTAWTTGKVGGAVTFNGTSGQVDLGAIDVSTGEITLAAWVNATSLLAASSDNRILSKTSGVQEQDHYWMLSTIKQGNDTRLRFRLKIGGTTSTLISTSGNLSLNNWYHIAASYDGANMKLYVDGSIVASVAKTGSVDMNNTVMASIGANPDGTRLWNGIIDEVIIYDRGLDSTEISDLMNACSSAVDHSPPTVTGVDTSRLACGTSVTSLAINTNEASTCRYSTTANVSYGNMTNTFTTTGGKNHSTNLSGLSNGTANNYFVKCRDLSGNENTNDYQATILVNNSGGAAPIVSVTTSTLVICKGDSVSFNAGQTVGADSYAWTFNIGLPLASSSVSATVTYSDTGLFTVQLVASNDCGGVDSAFSETVQVLPCVASSLADQLNTDVIMLYPNPAQDFLTVHGLGLNVKSVKVYTTQGEEIRVSLQGNRLNVHHLAKGTYLIKVHDGSKSVVRKFSVL